MPIFKKFVQNVVRKKDALTFKVPQNINLVLVDVETGLEPNFNTKKFIYESFKSKNNSIIGLEKNTDKDKLSYSNSKIQKTILRFY